MPTFDFLSGYRTYLGAAGLFGLAIYQFSQGDYAEAYQSAMQALAVFGARAAIAKIAAK